MREGFSPSSAPGGNMLLEEWNIEDAKEVWREEALEEGREQVLELLEQGLSIEEIKNRLSQKEKK